MINDTLEDCWKKKEEKYEKNKEKKPRRKELVEARRLTQESNPFGEQQRRYI